MLPQHKTRCGYHKHDVLSALTVSLLRQQQQDALFWAFELLCSTNQKNYKKRTVNHLLGCFYYFYYTQSPHMESKVQTLLKNKDDGGPKWSVEQAVAQVIKLFVKLPFNLDVYLLQSWWWISATTNQDDAKYKKETKRWFEHYTAKESRIALARYIVQEQEQEKQQEQEKNQENKKIKKIYVTQVPQEQWLPLTQLQPTKDDDGNPILPKPMIACDCWTQAQAQAQRKNKSKEQKEKKEPLKLKDLFNDLTNANKITNSILIGKHAISQNELHDMQFLTQETVANYWTKETQDKETTLAEMMACFPAYTQSKINENQKTNKKQ